MTFKQLCLPSKIPGLTLHIDGTTNEKYTLMIAGGDYYQKLEGVQTNSGQTDTFQTTGTGLTINFDDAKTGTYSLLVDNFHDYGTTNTGTVYVDSTNVIPQPQQYTIDWNKVVQNTSDATQHTIDTNNDGIIGNTGDTTTNLPPVYQDITPPTTTATLTGTLVPNSTGSYYDTATITLNAIDQIVNTLPGSGVEKTYYSINTGSILTYTGSIILTNTGTTIKNYTLNYHSVDKFNNIEPTKTLTFSIIKTPPQTIPTYTFPTQTITWNSGQQTAISSWYTVVGNIPGYTWGQNIAFTTGGQGTPTVQTTNGNRTTNGIFQGGLNIEMNVPPRGETYTGYVDIQGLRLEFITKRDSAPPSEVGTLDFGTQTVNYSGIAISNRYTFPFLPDPTTFTLSGSGNPTVQTSNGTRNNTGTVNYGTNIQAEIPPVGQTRVIEFTILGKTGRFTIKRQ